MYIGDFYWALFELRTKFPSTSTAIVLKRHILGQYAHYLPMASNSAHHCPVDASSVGDETKSGGSMYVELCAMAN
jgi:hypothetical protein